MTASRRSVETTASIVDGAPSNLLGRDQICSLGLLQVAAAATSPLIDPVKEFPKLFTGLGEMPGTFNIALKEDTVPRCLYTPRSIPLGLREAAKAELDEMVKLEVIEPVEEPTDWCSGHTIVPKPNGKI